MLRSLIIIVLVGVLSSCYNPSARHSTETVLPTPYDAEHEKESIQIDSQEIITIVLTGDVMIGFNYPDTLMPVDSGRHLFSEVADWLQYADVTVGNLEGVISNLGQPKKECFDTAHCYYFRMPEELTPRLAEAGYDALSIANNHSRDFGDSAIVQTLAVLEQNNIACAGQRYHCKEAIFERNGHTYGFMAFSPHGGSMSMLNIPAAQESIRDLKSRCEIVIVSMHGGAEGVASLHTPDTVEFYFDESRGCVKEFAHAAIDAGADIVYGHGPHVPRAVEIYNKRFIAYSLGNFCTPFKVSTQGYCGYAPVIRLSINTNGEVIKAEVLSAIQHPQSGPHIDYQNRAARLIGQLTEEDFPQHDMVVDSTDVLTYRIKK